MQETNPIELKKRFEEYLDRKQLNSKSTIKRYLYYWDKFDVVNGKNSEYVGLFLSRYNQCVGRAFVNNLLDFFNITDIKVPKITGRKKKKLIKYLSKEEIDLIEEAMNCERNKIMVALSFQTGLRLSELLGIKFDDFRWKKWKDKPKRACELVIPYESAKGNTERVVFVAPILMTRIFDYLIKIRKKVTQNDPIFRLRRTRWQKLVEIAGYKALDKRINPHMFRHSLATHLINKGMSIEKVKEILGHKSIASTQVYIHINQDDLKSDFEEVF